MSEEKPVASDVTIKTTEGTEGTEFNVKTAFGEIRTKGYRLGDILNVVWGVALCVLCYIAWDTQKDVKIAAETVAASTKADHDQMRTAIERGTEAQVESNYIQTLDARQKESLNLRMPESLRRKVIGRDP